MNPITIVYFGGVFVWLGICMYAVFMGMKNGLVVIGDEDGKISGQLALRLFITILGESMVWPFALVLSGYQKAEAMKAMRTGKPLVDFREKRLQIPHTQEALRQWFDLMERVSHALHVDQDGEEATEDPTIAWRVFQDAAWSALQVAGEKQEMPREYLQRLLMEQARDVCRERTTHADDRTPTVYDFVFAADVPGCTLGGGACPPDVVCDNCNPVASDEQ